jgi:hypothetical protein
VPMRVKGVDVAIHSISSSYHQAVGDGINSWGNGDPERRGQPQDVGPTHSKPGSADYLAAAIVRRGHGAARYLAVTHNPGPSRSPVTDA